MKFRIWDLVLKKMRKWEEVMNLPVCEIFSSTSEQRRYIVMRYTEKTDIDGTEVCENDIIENFNGTKMKIRFGIYPLAYCPVDESYVDGVGFYAEAPGLPPMPIGNTEEYARVVGNIFESPELMND